MTSRFALSAAFLAVVVGCGAARDSGPESGDTSVVVTRHSPSEVTTKVVGASSKQREILVDALSGIGETKLDVIEVTRAEEGWVDDPDAVGVECSAGGEELDMRSDWECWLVTQALAVRSSELDLPVVAYVGGRGPGVSSVGRASRQENHVAATEAETKRIGQRVAKAAGEAGADVVQVEVLEPRGLAVAITVRVSDPAQFLDKRIYGLLDDLGHPPNGPEAGDRHLRVMDKRGDRIVELAGASLGGGGIGGGWVRPDLLGCYYPGMSRPMGWEPPPCPNEARNSKREHGS